ncbi:glycosyltransferase family 4 protein [Stratiformator vulcanicus]|uniref:Glycosyl transferases group 1 n=1 Tax=Stratiformator vulcanicus TaxID=2527980 RepID=A0A517QXF3_9PLAN|nr:glycosyltransferase family 4 protein [Stratiformator vulcanicus]QDT36329.1 Glycosyl transferases group 1 [Stratiformator vulcanicus]
MNAQHIGFISTRFAGTDGVSLESSKWAEVLWDHRHVSFWYAGKLDRDPAISMCVPEAYFGHPDILAINDAVFGQIKRSKEMTKKIKDMADRLKDTLYEFVEKFGIDILVAQNSLTIPMNIPLGVALTNFIAETGFPTIAHHHDFYWERDRFMVNAVGDYLEMAFPPKLPSIQHVTINSPAQEDLSWRTGCSSILIPNVLDFDQEPEACDLYSSDFRKEINIAPDDILILQPTRVVPRKGIEHSINLLAQLNDPRCKLVVTHESGDEGQEYQNALMEMASNANVDLRFVAARVGETRYSDAEGRKVYSLWDTYPHADFITYPSLYEGFGNALLEAFYFRKPVLVNRYSIFRTDIEPKGFRVITMDGFLTRSVIEDVRRVIQDRPYREAMVDLNYELAKRFFSYSVLLRKLRAIVCNFTGQDDL